jgi:hypothetical protein
MIAEMMIKEMFTTEPGEYVGEYESKDSIYKSCNGCFVEGLDNAEYIQFIKRKGLVNLMARYWELPLNRKH